MKSVLFAAIVLCVACGGCEDVEPNAPNPLPCAIIEGGVPMCDALTAGACASVGDECYAYADMHCQCVVVQDAGP